MTGTYWKFIKRRPLFLVNFLEIRSLASCSRWRLAISASSASSTRPRGYGNPKNANLIKIRRNGGILEIFFVCSTLSLSLMTFPHNKTSGKKEETKNWNEKGNWAINLARVTSPKGKILKFNHFLFNFLDLIGALMANQRWWMRQAGNKFGEAFLAIGLWQLCNCVSSDRPDLNPPDQPKFSDSSRNSLTPKMKFALQFEERQIRRAKNRELLQSSAKQTIN